MKSQGNASEGLAIASLVLGIVALVKKQGRMAIAGIALIVIPLIVSLFWMLALGSGANEINKQTSVNTSKPAATKTIKTPKKKPQRPPLKKNKEKMKLLGKKMQLKS